MYKQYIMQINNVHKGDGTLTAIGQGLDQGPRERNDSLSQYPLTFNNNHLRPFCYTCATNMEKPNNLLNSSGHYTKQINI